MRLKVGTRASKLAMVQTHMFVDAVEAACPSITCEIVPMTTTGDKILDRPLAEIGGKGLFVRELDRALMDGEVDVTVHSCKDLPMETPEELPLVAFSRREEPYDALVVPKGVDLGGQDALDYIRETGCVVGCSSARRRLQLERLVPGVCVKSVRGNVGTRLSKLDSGEFGALLLASAGLVRLGLAGRIARRFSAMEMIPSAGQGIIVAQARAGEEHPWASCFEDRASRLRALAERAFVRELDGGCTMPCAAHATISGDGGAVALSGMYATPDEAHVAFGQTMLTFDNLEAGARQLAREVRARAH